MHILSKNYEVAHILEIKKENIGLIKKEKYSVLVNIPWSSVLSCELFLLLVTRTVMVGMCQTHA